VQGARENNDCSDVFHVRRIKVMRITRQADEMKNASDSSDTTMPTENNLQFYTFITLAAFTEKKHKVKQRYVVCPRLRPSVCPVFCSNVNAII